MTIDASFRRWKADARVIQRILLNTRTHGFSLIELVVALAIFGILMAIAIPSYKAYVIRSNRTDAESQLLQMAQAMERYYTANDTYLNGGVPMSGTTLDNGAYKQSPATGTAIYTLSLDTAAANTATYYRLKASPVTGLLNSSNGYLTIDSTGVKAWDSNNSGTISTTENTWNP